MLNTAAGELHTRLPSRAARLRRPAFRNTARRSLLTLTFCRPRLIRQAFRRGPPRVLRPPRSLRPGNLIADAGAHAPPRPPSLPRHLLPPLSLRLPTHRPTPPPSSPISGPQPSSAARPSASKCFPPPAPRSRAAAFPLCSLPAVARAARPSAGSQRSFRCAWPSPPRPRHHVWADGGWIYRRNKGRYWIFRSPGTRLSVA